MVGRYTLRSAVWVASISVAAAQRVLDAPGASALGWHDVKDRTQADRVRVEILETLMQLAGDT